MGDWKDAAQWLWLGLLGLIKLLWNKQEERFKKLEDNMYSKTQAQERQMTVTELLEARRLDVITLHSKIDASADKMNTKIDKLKDDVSEGFSDLKDILLRRNQ